MYSELSKKEKEKKLAQARKRAVQWSAQQQTRAALRKTSSLKRSSTPTNLPLNIDTSTSDHSVDLSFNTPIPLSDNRTNTIQAIQDTLKDLKAQREAIDTTIQVLNQRLQFLLNEPKSR